ncbi:unnamed protein product [Meganyctiphanes norvegica]|uniref:Malate dehydrogenase n=1 Tax=Meganyctiphanes norvegica TaxID=48144 RepID=A0AAV2PVR9_MEGNR
MAAYSSLEGKANFTPPDNLPTKIPCGEVTRYIVDCLTATGAPLHGAHALAEVLVAADTRGHYSHGLNRLEMYVNDLKRGLCDGAATPTIEKESVSTALVQGNNGLGPVVGKFCMNLAIEKARETGIGWVAARGSNHYGIAGYYAMMASSQGLMGMSFTNTSPIVAPTRAKAGVLGTNPICLAAPGRTIDDPFVLDMATCTAAAGKIEIQNRKGEPLPDGWAMGTDGKVTTDPKEAMKASALLPLGGDELHSGYKGYGLAMMVEVFCGIMAGSHFGPNIRKWFQTEEPADLGHAFVAIDQSFFAPGFEGRMGDLMDHCRNMEPVDPEKPVLVAGDPERSCEERIRREGGVTYLAQQMNESWKLAKLLGVEPMKGL